MISLTSARDLAAKAIRRAQAQYKHQYDKNVRQKYLNKGDWILVHFPQDETGRWRKLSRPWHGPYRIVELTNTGVTCVKVYYPQEGKLHVHQSRVCVCPQEFPAGFYWYGGKRKGPGRPPKWVDCLLQSGSADNTPPLSNGAPDQTNDRQQPEDDHLSASHKEGNRQTSPHTQSQTGTRDDTSDVQETTARGELVDSRSEELQSPVNSEDDIGAFMSRDDSDEGGDEGAADIEGSQTPCSRSSRQRPEGLGRRDSRLRQRLKPPQRLF